jgi:hypothetical protein
MPIKHRRSRMNKNSFELSPIIISHNCLRQLKTDGPTNKLVRYVGPSVLVYKLVKAISYSMTNYNKVKT